MPESIISARTENLDEASRASIIQVCIEAHLEPDFKNLFTYVPLGGLHFMAYCDDQLVSHAMVTTRWLQPEGLPELKTAYIDAVATLPAFQRQGYASVLLQQIAKDIDDEYVIACLETDRRTFYERLGWEVWRGPLAGRSKDGLIPTPNRMGIMILRLSRTPPLDLDRGLTIEDQGGRIW